MYSGAKKTCSSAVAAGMGICSLAIGHKRIYFSITDRASLAEIGSGSLLHPLVPSKTSTRSGRKCLRIVTSKPSSPHLFLNKPYHNFHLSRGNHLYSSTPLIVCSWPYEVHRWFFCLTVYRKKKTPFHKKPEVRSQRCFHRSVSLGSSFYHWKGNCQSTYTKN